MSDTIWRGGMIGAGAWSDVQLTAWNGVPNAEVVALTDRHPERRMPIVERFGINSVIIVITPSTSERMVMPLRQVKGHGTPVIVILLDSASFGGTVSAVNATGSLVSSGFQVYVVKNGDELDRALDSRVLIPQARYIGEVV